MLGADAVDTNTFERFRRLRSDESDPPTPSAKGMPCKSTVLPKPCKAGFFSAYVPANLTIKAMRMVILEMFRHICAYVHMRSFRRIYVESCVQKCVMSAEREFRGREAPGERARKGRGTGSRHGCGCGRHLGPPVPHSRSPLLSSESPRSRCPSCDRLSGGKIPVGSLGATGRRHTGSPLARAD